MCICGNLVPGSDVFGGNLLCIGWNLLCILWNTLCFGGLCCVIMLLHDLGNCEDADLPTN